MRPYCSNTSGVLNIELNFASFRICNDILELILSCLWGPWFIRVILIGCFQDGMTCMIEASRNGHTRVVETLLNWHGVPVSGRSSAAAAAKSSSLQNSRLKKVCLSFRLCNCLQ